MTYDWRRYGLMGHPDIIVPTALALDSCIVSSTDETPEALRQALLASEARAMELERMLPETAPRLYDALVEPHLPARFDAPANRGPTAAKVDGRSASGVYLTYVHFTEWALIDAIGAAAGRKVSRYTYTHVGWARMFEHILPPGPEVWLPPGIRSDIELGALLVERRRLIREALHAALDTDQTVWVVGGMDGLVYLGDGLCRDVGEGFDAPEADAARAAWVAACDFLRRVDADGAPPALPCRMKEPLRLLPGSKKYLPVGRLSWPDTPDTPWLQLWGASLPERVLALFEFSWRCRGVTVLPPGGLRNGSETGSRIRSSSRWTSDRAGCGVCIRLIDPRTAPTLAEWRTTAMDLTQPPAFDKDRGKRMLAEAAASAGIEPRVCTSGIQYELAGRTWKVGFLGDDLSVFESGVGARIAPALDAFFWYRDLAGQIAWLADVLSRVSELPHGGAEPLPLPDAIRQFDCEHREIIVALVDHLRARWDCEPVVGKMCSAVKEITFLHERTVRLAPYVVNRVVLGGEQELQAAVERHLEQPLDFPQGDTIVNVPLRLLSLDDVEPLIDLVEQHGTPVRS